MAIAADSHTRDKRRTSSGEGTALAVSPLPGAGLCALALEADDRAEDAGDFSGDHRTSRTLLGGSSGRGEGVFDPVPENLERWTTFGGVSFCGVSVAQYWVEFILWESLLNERRYEQIVELGTWEGGFSLWLHAQAQAREMGFRTYDVHVPKREIPGFVHMDVFAFPDEVGEHLRRSDPVIVLCDGGNKPRELKTFSRYVTPDSTLVVHDWGTEFLPSDIPENVEMIHEDYCLDLGSISRVFRVRDV